MSLRPELVSLQTGIGVASNIRPFAVGPGRSSHRPIPSDSVVRVGRPGPTGDLEQGRTSMTRPTADSHPSRPIGSADVAAVPARAIRIGKRSGPPTQRNRCPAESMSVDSSTLRRNRLMVAGTGPIRAARVGLESPTYDPASAVPTLHRVPVLVLLSSSTSPPGCPPSGG